MAPRTRYARNGDVHLAYQVFGAGAVDLLYVPQSFSQVEHLWEHPAVARYLDRLAEFARVVIFDRRESGMSDRRGRAPTLEEQIDDVIAVLDAAGTERACVFAIFEGTAMAGVFAASHPARVRALAVYGGFARTTRAEDYDWAPTIEERRARFELIDRAWGDGREMVESFAPDHRDDRTLIDWIGKLQRYSMSPGAAKAQTEINHHLDIRHVLPTIRVPTLVLRRRDAPGLDPRHARYLADHIPDARLVELEGTDAFPFLGDTDALVGELEEFFTGQRLGGGTGDRVLATVLFTDIIGSTQHAAALGDRAWNDRLTQHDLLVRRCIERFSGREVKTLGDGFLATFDGPARAILAGRTMVREIESLGLNLRVGLHTGELELRAADGDVHGMAVNIAHRVMERAEPGEVLVSSTVRDLVIGSGIEFDARGEHGLEGVPDRWRLYAVGA